MSRPEASTSAPRLKFTGSSRTLPTQGLAILMISSELPEILGMSDRVLVMHEGRISGEFDRNDADQERIMFAATGQVAVGVPG